MHEKRISDTADCLNCPFNKKGQKCPNYIETFWHEDGNPQPLLIRDCAPKRTMLMLQELYQRCWGMQQQVNQAENQVLETKATVNKFIEMIHYMQEQQQVEKSAAEKLKRHLSHMKYCEPAEFKRIEEIESANNDNTL